jgi:hypothetical protein
MRAVLRLPARPEFTRDVPDRRQVRLRLIARAVANQDPGQNAAAAGHKKTATRAVFCLVGVADARCKERKFENISFRSLFFSVGKRILALGPAGAEGGLRERPITF